MLSSQCVAAAAAAAAAAACSFILAVGNVNSSFYNT
jgi:hypothetical protein